MGYFGVFEIPETIERDLVEFYLNAPFFALDELNDYRNELSQYYGVYFLYYRGDFELYRALAESNAEKPVRPIYIGKAVSDGGRTGERSLSKNSLYRRLQEHSRTIKAASTTLRCEDFDVRVIPMRAELVGWAEKTMIRRFRPIWNSKLSGFGIHDPGGGRYRQQRSIWDQIHPGRPWVERMESAAQYDLEAIRQYIQNNSGTDSGDEDR